MPLLRRDDARPFTLHGAAFSSYARSESGAHDLAAWRAEFAPHTPGTPHRMDREEVILILAGQLRIDIDAHTFNAAVGDAALVPAGALFCVSNETALPAALWATTTLGMTAQVEGAADRLRPPWAQ